MKFVTRCGLVSIIIALAIHIAGNPSYGADHVENSSLTPDTLFKYRQAFPIDSDKIVTTAELTGLALKVDSILRADSVTFVDVTGIASIDGPESLNNRLAKGRADAMASWLKKSTTVDPSIVTVGWIGEDWTWFQQMVEEDFGVPERANVLEIVRSKVTTIPAKENQLRKLAGGRTWAYLAKNIFPKMRVAALSLGGFHKFIVEMEPEPVEEVVEEVEVIEEAAPVMESEEVLEIPEYEVRNLYVKSNAPAWLMLWMNVAVEYDFASHWSVALPIYYSPFNYFVRKLKFRTFTVVPEIRWWLNSNHTGFFLNAHFGMNQFNYAKGGEWRYQTYKGHTPALGGGIGIGYRFYFCRNHRWTLEAAVGAGVYHLDYSIFENIPNGLIVGRRQRTFFGIDQASLSFAYSFGVSRKEVKK